MNTSADSTAYINKLTTLQPAINAWKIYLFDQEKSPYTIKSFEGDLNLLIKFLPADKTLGEITTADLNHFLEWVKNGRGKNIPCSPKSYARRITTLKSFFHWLQRYGTITLDPAKNVLQKTAVSPLPDVLSQDEQVLLLATAQKILERDDSDARPFTLLKLLLDTGIKKSECLNIKLQHIEMENPENPFLVVRYPLPKDRNKERKIVLNPHWLGVYRKYLSQYQAQEIVFPWSPRRLEYILEDLGKAAELSKHVSFSMCRWSCALNDFRAGMDYDHLRQKLGISKIQWREVKTKLTTLDQAT